MDTNIERKDSDKLIENVVIQSDLVTENKCETNGSLPRKNRIHNNAMYAASLWRNTIARVDPHLKTGFIG